ncbi:MAG TPA: TssQ family T6SS-associated lipoprotein [Noviherbaspirillum sp.]|nr:TssQ family T6SS-associated lipoprotein [Noviherbaspirillum sp.]
MQRLKLVALLLAVFAAGCAQVPTQTEGSTRSPISAPEAQSQYQQGLSNYRDNRFDTALGNLTSAVGSRNLQLADANNARKHIAFIHCAAGRELPCRDQFQAILQADPGFDLSPAEAGHPQWGPVWRSVKGSMEEKRALSKASSASATPAQQKLAEGIKEYDAGRYKEALEALQAALKAGLPAKADEMRAHKYTAFAYCLTARTKQCRAEFKQMFAKDPAFELLPSETGHPAWSSAYRSEKAAAAKKADKKQPQSR